jgi:hypothetical protein
VLVPPPRKCLSAIVHEGDAEAVVKGSRMDEIADRVARDRTNAARERTSIHEAQRLSN